MTRTGCSIAGALALSAGQALAWGNHALPTYRALEQMPEVVGAARVEVETLESFLEAEQEAIAALLVRQEAWARDNLDDYPSRPDALRFAVDPKHSDQTRRRAFLTALRVAPDSKFALFHQPDPTKALPAAATPLPYTEVDTLPEPSAHNYRFVALKPGERVAPLDIVATAADEPDHGLDINCWSDSPSEWGKAYDFGTQPFGNPALSYSSQVPFHLGFFHESGFLYLVAPFSKRTFPLLRSYQYGSLAALAFRTGHAYWGWRFAGMSLHYTQDLTQPYHARLAPAVSTLEMLVINALAMIGITSLKDQTVVLLSNRHLIVDRYQNERIYAGSRDPRADVLERALADASADASYPAWTDRYLRDIVAKQSSDSAAHLSEVIAASVPSKYANDPTFDLGAQGVDVDLIDVLSQSDVGARTALDDVIAELLRNFGAHTRNHVRGILKASSG